MLDLVGVFAFATYGASRALQARMNIFGVFVFVCAGLVAMGGGTVREIILRGTPIYLVDYWYVLVVVLAVITAILSLRLSVLMERGLLVLDAIGLGAFALFGAMRAAEHGFGLGGMMLCGALTAVGGGVLCDLVVGRPPDLFHGDLAAVPALVTAVLAWLLRDHLGEPAVVLALVGAAVAIRLITLLRGWTLWVPARGGDRPSSYDPWWNRTTVVLPVVGGWDRLPDDARNVTARR
ncbi:trimeric intracellular cation channel family protein [Actinoplanes sp. M2I2]|uniref:trimeric intracellular cation channel family protein n=1 Tax=Actinoplanes sp. M2I2 TaxID=1734444 RepID=UPI0020221513|nr:TRIC cation channel family protein [Actinoplanes sp. M2I2]